MFTGDMNEMFMTDQLSKNVSESLVRGVDPYTIIEKLLIDRKNLMQQIVELTTHNAPPYKIVLKFPLTEEMESEDKTAVTNMMKDWLKLIEKQKKNVSVFDNIKSRVYKILKRD